MVRKYYSGYLNYCFTTFYKDKKFVFDFVPLEGYTRGILYLNREEDMEALEASEEFKTGVITLAEVLGESESEQQDDGNPQSEQGETEQNVEGKGEGESEKQDGEVVVFDKVTKLQEAKHILSGEPYNVSVSNFMNKETILQKAQEAGVSFPNLQ
jgi:hypothetical protein